jgi:glycerol-3-phosphate acyltransferase PlsX
VYARTVYGIENPTVGVLSTGSEEGKGNDLVKEAFPLLKNSGLNFIGNVEGNDILTGKANVIVCDGFVGNVVLKFYESIGDRAKVWLMGKYPRVKGLVGYMFDRVLPIKKLSYEGEEEGSGILWGVMAFVRIAMARAGRAHYHGITRPERSGGYRWQSQAGDCAVETARQVAVRRDLGT